MRRSSHQLGPVSAPTGEAWTTRTSGSADELLREIEGRALRDFG
ncbi:hypothetical protein [Nocardioides sp.]